MHTARPLAAVLLVLAPAVVSSQTNDIAIHLDGDRVRSTDTVVVHYENRPGARTGEVWIEPASDPVQPKPVGSYQFISGPSGTVRLPVGGLAPGAYEVRVMMFRDPSRVDIRQPLTVVAGAPTTTPNAASTASAPRSAAPAAPPTPPGQSPFIPTAAAHMTTSRPTYAAGEPVAVVWQGFPSAQMEVWYEAPDAPLTSTPRTWQMATGSAGQLSIAPPNPGRTYELRYLVLADPTHTPHRAARFTVGGGSMTSVATGHYGCYFTQYPRGTGRSSIQYVEVLAGGRYREPRGSGAYTADRATATLRMTSGPLAGHVAHYRAGTDGAPALVFERAENDGPGGRPTIDVSATYCYFGQK